MLPEWAEIITWYGGGGEPTGNFMPDGRNISPKWVTHYAELSIMRRSASADAELADGWGLSVSQSLR